MENSGVLYMNVTARAEHFQNCWSSQCRSSLTSKSSDQGLIKKFFVDTGLAQWLPPQFNWNPHWGYNETVALIQFHGAKPMHLADCLPIGKLAIVLPTLTITSIRRFRGV
jgi:hypothetical protein